MPADAAVLEPQFADLDQQRASSLLGMWTFLATEVLLFGCLITAFLVYRYSYPADFEDAAGRLNVLIGGINTVVLLTSSLTMALAVHASRTGSRRLALWLALTALLGLAFMGLKAYEYYTDYLDGLVPRTGPFAAQDWGDTDPRKVELLLMFYYILTGLHAVHLTIGIGLVCYLIVRALGRPSDEVTVEAIGLYWHFVDVVWIFLLPLLYLSGHHTPADLHF